MERTIIKNCMRDGISLPKRIQNAPDLQLGLELFYTAFIDLHTCRPSGWGVSPITWTAIAEYARMYEMGDCLRDDLFFYIREMDKAYMDYTIAKQKK